MAEVPPNLIFEILARLPLKSVVRFKCLSKFYASFGRDQLFVKAHAIRFPIRPIGLLVTCSAPLQSAQMFFTVNFNGGQVVSLLTVPDRFSRYSTHSIKGLVCMDFGIMAKVCNPSTRQVTTLPFVCEPGSAKASSTFFCVNSLGFDPVKKKFKVLNSWAVPGKRTEYRVFTLGIDTQWRLLDGGPYFLPMRESVCMDGVVFFRGWRSTSKGKGALLVAFDVASESFREISIPVNCPFDESDSNLIRYKGQPAIVDYRLADIDYVLFWVLKDIRNEHYWVPDPRYLSVISQKGPEGEQMYFVAGSFRSSELLVVPRSRRFSSNLRAIRWNLLNFYLSAIIQINGLPPCHCFDFSANAVSFTFYEESILSF